MAYRLLAGAAVCALIAAAPAAADDWRRSGGWDSGWRNDHRHGGHNNRHYDDNDDAEDAALLIGGALIGYVVGDLIDNDSRRSSNTYSSPSYGYGSSYNYGYSAPSYDYGYGYSAPTYTPPAPSYNYAPPSSGYTYVSNTNAPCSQVRSGRTATGAVIGGLVGGLIGNGVAADKNRDEGAAVGVALGSMIGGSIGHSSAECGGATAAVYNTPAAYTPPAPTYGYSDPYGDPYRGLGSSPSYEPDYRYEDELYGGPSTSYGSGYSGPAAEECERVMRVTKLPDGREIHEPIEVCRQAYYGDWSVQD